MKLSKLFETLYQKLYIAIVYSKESVHIHVDTYKKSNLLESKSKSFSLEKLGTLVDEYISDLSDETPFTYIVLLNSATNQGALCNCEMSTINEQVGAMDVKTLCINKRWMLYSSKSEIDELIKKHKSYGVDYIFSPFHLIKEFFHDKMNEKKTLFVLLQDESVSVSIFQNSNVVFAQQIDLEESSVFDEEDSDTAISLEFDIEIDGEAEGIKLDDIDALDELDELSDLSDIEDLDAFEELDEFTEESEEVVEEKESEVISSTHIDTFDAEYIKYSVIKESIDTYYSDDKYDKEFIEDIYIADAQNASEDLKRYLEEELFLHVIVRHIDVAKEIAALAFKERSYV